MSPLRRGPPSPPALCAASARQADKTRELPTPRNRDPEIDLSSRPILDGDVADDGNGAARRRGLAAGRGDRFERLAEQAHAIDVGGDGHRDLLVADGSDCLDAAGTGAAGDALVDIARA